MVKDETTLLIKLPPELKGAFQGLCKARGVSVSSELRRFMADQLNNATKGIGSAKTLDDPRSRPPKSIKTARKASSNRPNSKSQSPNGDKTPDLFDLKRPQEVVKSTLGVSDVGKHDKTPNKAIGGKLGLKNAITLSMKGR